MVLIPILYEIRVHLVGRYWTFRNQQFDSLEEIRKQYGYRCVIIIERW